MHAKLQGTIVRHTGGSIVRVDSTLVDALHRTTQLLHDILPRLSPADAKTMGLVSAMISENERILKGGE